MDEAAYAVPAKKPSKAKKIIIFAIILGMLSGAAIWYFEPFKTDEQKITECLQGFAAAYSVGDVDKMCSYLDKNGQASVKAIYNIGSGFFGKVAGGVNLGDVLGLGFGLSSATSGEDSVQIEVNNIQFVNNGKATVKLTLKMTTALFGYRQQESSKETVTVVKEAGKWRILAIG